MAYLLGALVPGKGCLTRLIDIINKEPPYLEDLVGFRRGRLNSGYAVLLLKQRFGPGEFEFYGYTYMSDGRIGLPSNDAAVEALRPPVHQLLMDEWSGREAERNLKKFSEQISLTGQHRYVKIVPTIGHDPSMGAADQY